MQKYVKRIGDERLQKVPKDLDLKPYFDDEHDDDLPGPHAFKSVSAPANVRRAFMSKISPKRLRTCANMCGSTTRRGPSVRLRSSDVSKK